MSFLLFIFSITGAAVSKDPLRFFVVFKKAINPSLQACRERAPEKAGIVLSRTRDHQTGICGCNVNKPTGGGAFPVITSLKSHAASGPQVDKAAAPSPPGYSRISVPALSGEIKLSAVVPMDRRKAGALLPLHEGA